MDRLKERFKCRREVGKRLPWPGWRGFDRENDRIALLALDAIDGIHHRLGLIREGRPYRRVLRAMRTDDRQALAPERPPVHSGKALANFLCKTHREQRLVLVRGRRQRALVEE